MNKLTATGYVLSPDKSQILLIFHKKLGRWLPAGGHVDENEIPHIAVIREVLEETGLDAKIIDYSPPLDCGDSHTVQIPAPFCMHLDEIPPYGQSEKRYYIDMSFILQSEQTTIKLQENEVDDARWFTRQELNNCDTWEIVKKIALQVMN